MLKNKVLIEGTLDESKMGFLVIDDISLTPECVVVEEGSFPDNQDQTSTTIVTDDQRDRTTAVYSDNTGAGYL